MSKPTITVRTSSGSYPVEFIPSESSIIDSRTDSFHVVDRFFQASSKLHDERIVWVTATEENKTLQTVEDVCFQLRQFGLERNGRIRAIGGGITQDIATLAAALYMRGVGLEYVPTTVLGMVDSCIGGKSSINTREIKNLLGNIYPPASVLIHTQFAKTLRLRDINSGLVEALKIAYCAGSTEYGEMSVLLRGFKLERLDEVVWKSLTWKKRFIEQDEFDQGERLKLNFGHTFGHAIESATDFLIPHGIAVALGMICAIRVAQDLGKISEDQMNLEESLRELIASADLGLIGSNFDEMKFRRHFKSDKKHSQTHFRLVLPTGHEGVSVCELDRKEEVEDFLAERVTEVVLDLLQ